MLVPFFFFLLCVWLCVVVCAESLCKLVNNISCSVDAAILAVLSEVDDISS